MTNPLIGLHAALGELGFLAFIWVFVELLNPTEERIKRARIAAVLGAIFIFGSWAAGGFYYVNVYGQEVKPAIKAGPEPWAHSIFMETKEHVFLFLPFLSVLEVFMVFGYGNKLIKDRRMRLSVLLIAGLIVLLGLAMVGMGYIISSGFRSAIVQGGLAV
jgi:hypothetical protein